MKYFTKYLPVEGEIKDGDTYLFDGKIQTCKVSIIKELEEFYGRKITEYQKVKLFLCSRDIETSLGEISPSAIWVKEGDEFEEEDIQLGVCLFDQKTEFSNIHTMKAQIQDYPKHYRYVYGIKCPTCKTYH